MKKIIILIMLICIFLSNGLCNTCACDGNALIDYSQIEIDELPGRIVREIEEFREKRAKYFELDDGQIMRIDYPIDIHEQNGQGVLEESKNFIEFNNKDIKIFRGEYEILINHKDLGKSQLIEIDKGHKIYKNMYRNVDLECKILSNKFEENLILRSKDVQNEFIFDYSLKGLRANKIDDKTIELLDKDLRCIYKISAPKMFDSNGETSDKIFLDILENREDKLKIKVICDRDWIDDEKRVFPISIDPDYTDELFCFSSSMGGQVFSTNWRKKDTNSSIFLNLTGSKLKNFGVVSVSIFGRNAKGEINCTYKADHYLLEAGKKYEIYNSASENGCKEVQIRFKTLLNQYIYGKWSPDYKPQRDTLRIGGAGGLSNTKDSEFRLVISPDRTCWTTIRTKTNDSSVYLKLFDPSGRGGSVKCSVWGLGGLKRSENCTYDQESYTLQFGQKYELLNSVKERENSGVQLRFEGNAGTEIKGEWSPDYARDPECVRVPSSIGSKIRPAIGGKIIKVRPMTQHCGFPSGCEATSAAMVIHFYGYRPIGHYKRLITDFIKKMDVKPAKNKGEGPDPNYAFAGHPTQNGYGCFAPCIAKTMERFFKENAKIGCMVEIVKGKSLEQLTRDYISKDIPVLIWATINMTQRSDGNSWKVTYPRSSPLYNKKFIWPAGEHCIVLVGFNEKDFFVNDPYQNEDKVIGAYNRKALEKSYSSMGSQAVVVHNLTKPAPVIYESMNAIWLQDENAVNGQGHTGLLLQAGDRKWYHFYWGNNGEGFANCSKVGTLSLLNGTYNNHIDVNKTKIYKGTYTDSLYFVGNFLAGLEYARSIVGKKDYNLFTDNCVQVSIDVLTKGTFEKEDNCCGAEDLKKVRGLVSPNMIFNTIKKFKAREATDIKAV